MSYDRRCIGDDEWPAPCATCEGRDSGSSTQVQPSDSLIGSMPILSAREYQKRFVWCPLEIPMDFLNEEWAQKNHSQSLERLAERGGLDPTEVIANIEHRSWKKMDIAEALKQLQNFMA